MDRKINHVFNIVLVGAMRTGKSCFVSRYVKNIFNENYKPTIGGDLDIREITSSTSSKIRMTLWDTSGDDSNDSDFQSLSLPCYRGANGFLVLFDVTNRESFEKVPSILQNIDNHATCACNPIKIILIANKIDLAEKRQVSREEANLLADQLGITYIEASAKENINIEEVFNKIVADIESSLIADPDPVTGSTSFRCSIL